jgi:hypothetical protein
MRQRQDPSDCSAAEPALTPSHTHVCGFYARTHAHTHGHARTQAHITHTGNHTHTRRHADTHLLCSPSPRAPRTRMHRGWGLQVRRAGGWAAEVSRNAGAANQRARTETRGASRGIAGCEHYSRCQSNRGAPKATTAESPTVSSTYLSAPHPNLIAHRSPQLPSPFTALAVIANHRSAISLIIWGPLTSPPGPREWDLPLCGLLVRTQHRFERVEGRQLVQVVSDEACKCIFSRGASLLTVMPSTGASVNSHLPPRLFTRGPRNPEPEVVERHFGASKGNNVAHELGYDQRRVMVLGDLRARSSWVWWLGS